MAETDIRDKLMEEIKLIPDFKLSEVYDFIHYLRLGVQKSKVNIDQIMHFAGCWKDMPDNEFDDFLDDILRRRDRAFAWRRSDEASIG